MNGNESIAAQMLLLLKSIEEELKKQTAALQKLAKI